MEEYTSIDSMFLEYSKVAMRTCVDPQVLLASLFNGSIPNLIYFVGIGVIGRDGRYSIIKWDKETGIYTGLTVEGLVAAKNILTTYKLQVEDSITITNTKINRGNDYVYINFTVLEDLI